MQDKPKINPEQFPDAERDEWSAEDISEQAANEQPDETVRKILRGDETSGNPNDRDVVGGVDSADTPQGSEEVKTEIKEKNS